MKAVTSQDKPTVVGSPVQRLHELYEVYADLDREEKAVVKEELRLLLTPEYQLALQIAELNRSSRQIVRDLQTLRKGA